MAPTKFTKPFPRKFKTGSKGFELSIYAEGLVPKDQKLSSQICIPATSSHVQVGYKMKCKKAAGLPGLKRPAQPHPLSGTSDPPFRVFDSTDLGDVDSYLVLDVWESESDGASSSSSSSTGRSKERDVRPSYFHRFRSHLHQRQASRGRSRVRSRKPWWNRRTAPSQVFDRRWGREERVSRVDTSRENLLHQGLYAQTIAQKRCRGADEDEDEEASPCFKRIRYGQTAVH